MSSMLPAGAFDRHCVIRPRHRWRAHLSRPPPLLPQQSPGQGPKHSLSRTCPGPSPLLAFTAHTPLPAPPRRPHSPLLQLQAPCPLPPPGPCPTLKMVVTRPQFVLADGPPGPDAHIPKLRCPQGRGLQLLLGTEGWSSISSAGGQTGEQLQLRRELDVQPLLTPLPPSCRLRPRRRP